MSPRPVISPMSSSPSWSTPHRESETWSYLTAVAKPGPPSRAPSRSSIASTHISDRASPPAPLPPSSNGVVKSPAVKDVLEPPDSVEPKSTEEVNSEPTNLSNGTSDVSKAASAPLPELTPAPKPAPPVPAKSVVTVSADVSMTKQDSTLSSMASLLNDEIFQLKLTFVSGSLPKTITQASEVPTTKPSGATTLRIANNERAPPTPPPVLEPRAPSPPVPSPSPLPPHDVRQESAKTIKEVLEIKQPKPTYISSPIGSPLITPAEINIPPPTHSPVLTTPPPIHQEPTPAPAPKHLPAPEEIPPFSEAKTTRDALKIVVMTRLLCDRQSKEERVNPVLAANLSISNPPEAHPIATPDTLIEKMFSGRNLKERIDSFIKTRPLLNKYLTKRNTAIQEKIARLREEYLTLHERWVAHCNALNEQQKTLASEHENTHTGRTTRRSTLPCTNFTVPLSRTSP